MDAFASTNGISSRRDKNGWPPNHLQSTIGILIERVGLITNNYRVYRYGAVQVGNLIKPGLRWSFDVLSRGIWFSHHRGNAGMARMGCFDIKS